MIHNYILKTIIKYVYYSGIVKCCFFMEKHHHPELLSKVECCTTIESFHRWCLFIEAGGQRKFDLVCGYIYRLADASSLHCFVQIVCFLAEQQWVTFPNIRVAAEDT